MLVVYATARLDSEFSSRLALDRFNILHAIGSDPALQLNGNVDFTLWNPKRIQAYQQSLQAKTDLPIAVLQIPKIHLEVPVFNGTDDATLNRGVGRVPGTAEIGQRGNMAIAGHRDGFFRGLKDIGPGDTLNLVTPNKTIHFVIERTEVVQPEDVSVLADTGIRSLTLVTCFPFYFVGNAPQRFIVHASSADFDGQNSPSSMLAGQIQNEGELK
jgi:sortase A